MHQDIIEDSLQRLALNLGVRRTVERSLNFAPQPREWRPQVVSDVAGDLLKISSRSAIRSSMALSYRPRQSNWFPPDRVGIRRAQGRYHGPYRNVFFDRVVQYHVLPTGIGQARIEPGHDPAAKGAIAKNSPTSVAAPTISQF